MSVREKEFYEMGFVVPLSEKECGSETLSIKIHRIFLERIKNNSADPFSFHKVCCSLHLSERSLYRRLREEGVSYLEVKDKFRQAYAAFLLSTGDYTVTEVSNLLFFKNTSYFVQFFKRDYGQTPKKWMNVNVNVNECK